MINGNRGCIHCGAIFMNQFYRGVACSDCMEKGRAIRKKRTRIWRLSFFFFPIGFLLSNVWKESNPQLAETARQGAMTMVKTILVIGVLLFFVIINSV